MQCLVFGMWLFREGHTLATCHRWSPHSVWFSPSWILSFLPLWSLLALEFLTPGWQIKESNCLKWVLRFQMINYMVEFILWSLYRLAERFILNASSDWQWLPKMLLWRPFGLLPGSVLERMRKRTFIWPMSTITYSQNIIQWVKVTYDLFPCVQYGSRSPHMAVKHCENVTNPSWNTLLSVKHTPDFKGTVQKIM